MQPTASGHKGNELRPQTLDQIIGQKETVDVLNVTLRGAYSRNEALPHILLDGGPGLGKTSFATALANTYGVPVQIANGPAIRSIKNLLPYLSRVTDKSILFIDEIHRVPPQVQEFLYTALEDFKVYLVQDKTVPVTMELPTFTLVGATTEAGAISQPLYDRFVIHRHLRYYTHDELAKLVSINAKTLKMNMTDEACQAVAMASRGTPRVANNLLRWVRDFTVAGSRITDPAICSALTVLGVRPNGLDAQDQKYIDVLRDRFKGGPAGLASLAAGTGLSADTLIGTVEPYLLREGIIDKTPLGRILL